MVKNELYCPKFFTPQRFFQALTFPHFFLFRCSMNSFIYKCFLHIYYSQSDSFSLSSVLSELRMPAFPNKTTCVSILPVRTTETFLSQNEKKTPLTLCASCYLPKFCNFIYTFPLQAKSACLRGAVRQNVIN